MARVIKANWARRSPPKPSYLPTLEAEREQWNHERIQHVRSLVGSTERLPGVVCRIEKYGFFVKFNWGKGLVHISQISKNHIRHPNEVVSPGQEVQIYVMAVDDRNRISLSMIGPARDMSNVDRVPVVSEALPVTSMKAHDERPGTSQPVPLSAEVIEGKQPIRSFAELAAYCKLKEGDGSDLLSA
jgi:transcriptional accessory protein Tex/SPT6